MYAVMFVSLNIYIYIYIYIFTVIFTVCLCFCATTMAIQVFRQKIWMRKYGVPSWKATMLWSNSWHVQKLDLGAMTKEEKAESVPLAKTYTDKRGKKRCVGKKKP